MLATIKETVKSLGDLGYGKEIIKKTVGQSFWYWFKYPLTMAVVLLVVGVAAATYFSPQIPKLADKYIPEGEFSIKEGKASTTLQQPFVWEDSGFAFIVNLKGQESDLDNYDNGVLILEDQLVAKDDQGLRVIKWSEAKEDFSISREMLVKALEDNKLAILATLLGLIVLLVVLGLGFFVLFEGISLLISGAVFWVVAKIMKRSWRYQDVLKAVLYAAVPAFGVDLLNLLLPNNILPIVSMGVFVFFAAAWIYRLPEAQHNLPKKSK